MRIYDSTLDVEMEWDKIFSAVAVELTQYTIPDLKRMSYVKFMRLTREAEAKQEKKRKDAAHHAKAGVSRHKGIQTPE